MNKKSLIIFAGMLMLLITSCSKEFLNYKPYGEPSTVNFWKTESDATLAANGLYSFFTADEVISRGFFWYICASDDMIVGRDKTQAVNMKNFVDAGSNAYTTQNWPDMYQIVARANAILINVPKMNISQTTKDLVMGQAYFFRAWAY